MRSPLALLLMVAILFLMVCPAQACPPNSGYYPGYTYYPGYGYRYTGYSYNYNAGYSCPTSCAPSYPSYSYYYNSTPVVGTLATPYVAPAALGYYGGSVITQPQLQAPQFSQQGQNGMQVTGQQQQQTNKFQDIKDLLEIYGLFMKLQQPQQVQYAIPQQMEYPQQGYPQQQQQQPLPQPQQRQTAAPRQAPVINSRGSDGAGYGDGAYNPSAEADDEQSDTVKCVCLPNPVVNAGVSRFVRAPRLVNNVVGVGVGTCNSCQNGTALGLGVGSCNNGTALGYNPGYSYGNGQVVADAVDSGQYACQNATTTYQTYPQYTGNVGYSNYGVGVNNCNPSLGLGYGGGTRVVRLANGQIAVVGTGGCNGTALGYGVTGFPRRVLLANGQYATLPIPANVNTACVPRLGFGGYALRPTRLGFPVRNTALAAARVVARVALGFPGRRF